MMSPIATTDKAPKNVICDNCSSFDFSCTRSCRVCTSCPFRGPESEFNPGREGSWDCPKCGHNTRPVQL
jgi:hypothetical protein